MQYVAVGPEAINTLRGHKLSVTCVVISHDDAHLFSGSKDGAIIKCRHFVERQSLKIMHATIVISDGHPSLSR